MKNTIRVSRNNTSGTKAPQGKKPAIQGQKRAHSGQIQTAIRGMVKTKLKDKVDFPILCLGLELGLSDDEIQALTVLSNYELINPLDYCKNAVAYVLRASFEALEIEARNPATPEAKAHIEKTLSSIPDIFERSPSTPSSKHAQSPTNRVTERDDAVSLLESAVRQSAAFEVLLLNTLESDSSTCFRHDRGYLAAGVQTLMFGVRDDLENAYDAIREASKASNS